METASRILVVEDDPRVVVFVVDNLESMGFEILIARNGAEGLRKAREERPDLLVLDIMMPELDGYEVCRLLKADPETRQIPILMLTALGQVHDKVKGLEIGADQYLPKPYAKEEFEAHVRALLSRSRSLPFATQLRESTFSLTCAPYQPINIRVNGAGGITLASQNPLHIDTNVYARHGTNIVRPEWRFQSKDTGRHLYREIFTSHTEVSSNYNLARGAITEDEHLHLRFEAASDLLRVPLECLFDGDHQRGQYLALLHPLSRAMTARYTRHVGISPAFFNDLRLKDEKFRMLLIASNTLPPINAVDREISSLQRDLKALFKKRGIATVVDTLPTETATYEAVKRVLRKCKYHVVHYAGHGAYDAQSPERSYLSFWEEPQRSGDVVHMRASELHLLLSDSDVRFMYLSCCRGTQTGAPADLLDGDFLGIADSVVQAGVPAVLGFRWPVSDQGAKTLALEFYRSLAKQGQLDTALLHARREVAAADLDDITWLSPILIMQ